MSLREKALAGMKWSFIDSTVNQGIQFFFGLVLARLLNPRDWGLIGMLTFFIAVSQVFVDSGLSSALIRKKSCADSDYSTVFFFNLAAGLFFYLILFAAAGPIGRFYSEPRLVPLLRVLGLVILITAFSIIQRTILTREINFKLQTRISIISSLASGIIGIALALKGFGVWSLAARSVAQNATASVLLWAWVGWSPRSRFSRTSFAEMFGFGNKLLLSSLINAAFQNVYYLVIGRYFSATELGFYSRADQFKDLPSANLTSVVQRVSFPVLATMQDETARLKAAYRRLILCTMFIGSAAMIMMAAVAEPMILVLIGAKWLPTAPYLQLLCFAAVLYPLHALNLNILNVKGRSDLFLRLEFLKKVIAVPPIIVGVLHGIPAMIIGMIITSVLAYFMNSFYSSRLIDYPAREQIVDLLPSLAITGGAGMAAYAAGRILPLPPLPLLLAQLLLGAALIILLARTVKLEAYLEVKEIIAENMRGMKRRKDHDGYR